MLLVVTAQVMHQALYRHGPVPLEYPLPPKLWLVQPMQQVHGRRASRPEHRQRLGRIGLRISALPHQGVAVQRGQQRKGLVQQAPETRLIAVDLDVPHVADLLQRAQRLARYALPRLRRPTDEARRHRLEELLQSLRKCSQRIQGCRIQHGSLHQTGLAES